MGKIEAKARAERLQGQTAEDVESRLRGQLRRVIHIAITSKNLKGTYVKALKEAATEAMQAGTELAARVTTQSRI